MSLKKVIGFWIFTLTVLTAPSSFAQFRTAVGQSGGAVSNFGMMGSRGEVSIAVSLNGQMVGSSTGRMDATGNYSITIPVVNVTSDLRSAILQSMIGVGATVNSIAPNGTVSGKINLGTGGGGTGLGGGGGGGGIQGGGDDGIDGGGDFYDTPGEDTTDVY